MPPPFRFFDQEELPPEAVRLKERIEGLFAELEQQFERLRESPRRLKTMKELPIPSLAVPYELATVYALRALELAEGAALLVEHNLQAAAFPVLRSLYEIAMAVAYAEDRFRALVLKEGDWAKFDRIGDQLLLGSGGHQEGPFPLNTGHVVAVAHETLRRIVRGDKKAGDRLVESSKQTYKELTDGAHPTQWGIMGHFSEREDGLAPDWQRKPTDSISLGQLADLNLSLGLITKFLQLLEATAARLEEAARHAYQQDPAHRAATLQFLERVLTDEEVAPEPESQERIRAVIEHLRAERKESTDRDGEG